MIDWSKYPLSEARRYSPSYRDEFDRLVTDVRRAERKRCLSAVGKALFHYPSASVIAEQAIEALGDDDG